MTPACALSGSTAARPAAGRSCQENGAGECRCEGERKTDPDEGRARGPAARAAVRSPRRVAPRRASVVPLTDSRSPFRRWTDAGPLGDLLAHPPRPAPRATTPGHVLSSERSRTSNGSSSATRSSALRCSVSSSCALAQKKRVSARSSDETPAALRAVAWPGGIAEPSESRGPDLSPRIRQRVRRRARRARPGGNR